MTTLTKAPKVTSGQAARTWQSSVMQLLRKNPTVTALFSFLIVIAVFIPQFYTPYNVSTILGSQDLISIGFMALGAAFVISAGEIDLSLAGVCVSSSIVAALLSPYGAVIAILAALVFGAAAGAISGILVAYVRLPSFIVTLAMLMALRGLSLIMAGKGRVPVDREFGLVFLQSMKIGIIPVVFIIFAVVAGISWLVYNRSAFGVHVLAVGGDGVASELMGLRAPTIRFWVFVLSGTLSAFAGLFLLAKTTTGNPLEAQGWEMTAIAAVVLGGTLLSGGRGSIGGTIAGVALLTVVFQILNYLNGMGLEINAYLQNVVRGLFVLLVVVFQARVHMKQRKHNK